MEYWEPDTWTSCPPKDLLKATRATLYPKGPVASFAVPAVSTGGAATLPSITFVSIVLRLLTPRGGTCRVGTPTAAGDQGQKGRSSSLRLPGTFTLEAGWDATVDYFPPAH